MKRLNHFPWMLMLMLIFAPALTTATAAPLGVPVPNAVVYPTGLFPDDVENVQEAVDQGGLVLLKATNVDGQPTAFNFGPADFATGGGVAIENDVWVLGETQESGMTAIEGGFIPFFGLAGHVRIESLHFVRPQLSAIIIIQSTGAEVVGNRVTGVVPLDFGLTEARAIKFLANSFPITGTVVVADNLIEDMHPADFSDGIVFDEVEAEVDIENNFIAGVESNGILMINSRGPVRIADNFIVPGQGEPGSLGNGIAILNYLEFTSTSSFEVTRNRIICENPNADGMYLYGAGVTIDAPVVSNNDVTMHGSFFGAITFYGGVSDGRVSNNKIDGDGAFALEIVAFALDDAAEANTFNGNNISHFEAGIAHIFLDVHTHDTVVNGRVGSVIDLGVNNRVSGSK